MPSRETRPAVSVLLPVRNGAGTLPDALASVAAQSRTDWELLAVDDGSTDDTPALLAAAAARDPRIRVLRTAGSGLVAALNTGLAAARAPWIARLDADDVCAPTRLERQLAWLSAHPDCAACGTLVEHDGDPHTQGGFAHYVAWTNAQVTPEQIADARFIESPLVHPSMCFATELARRTGGYRDGAWPEDYELWLRWLDAGVRIGKVPEPLLAWRDLPGRLSRTDARYRPEAFYACKCHYLARWLRRTVDPRRRLLLWGAGRPTRRRFAALDAAGCPPAAYIDVDARKIGGMPGGRPVLPPEALPPPAEAFVILGVGTRGARALITAALEARGYQAGRDFMAAA